MPLSALDGRPPGGAGGDDVRGPGRREIRWTGEYREVVAPERLVFTISDQPDEDAYELVTVVLADLGDGRTEMRFEQRGHMAPEQYERAGEGWGGFFDRMAERLALALGRALFQHACLPRLPGVQPNVGAFLGVAAFHSGHPGGRHRAGEGDTKNALSARDGARASPRRSGSPAGSWSGPSPRTVRFAAVLRASATAYETVKLIGTVYLIFLGIQALRRAGRRVAAEGDTPGGGRRVDARRGFRGGLVSNLANPKVAVFFTRASCRTSSVTAIMCCSRSCYSAGGGGRELAWRPAMRSWPRRPGAC